MPIFLWIAPAQIPLGRASSHPTISNSIHPTRREVRFIRFGKFPDFSFLQIVTLLKPVIPTTSFTFRTRMKFPLTVSNPSNLLAERKKENMSQPLAKVLKVD